MNREELLKELDKIKDVVEGFQLSREDGTKKMQEEFHKKAVNDRNNYVIDNNKKLTVVRGLVEEELRRRYFAILPIENRYDQEEEEIKKQEVICIYSDRYMSPIYKIGASYIIDTITADSSLTLLNEKLEKCINLFREVGIVLSLENFNYSMFTYKYMELFLSTEDKESTDFTNKIRDLFEHIYWECPDIIDQLKLNFMKILKDNIKVIENYVNNKISSTGLNRDGILSKYIGEVDRLTRTKDCDIYNFVDRFLNNKLNILDYMPDAGVRVKNFNQLAYTGDYEGLSNEAKAKFRNSIDEFYYNLLELKKYYKYENIVKDLLKKYKDKDSNKTNYLNKLKEIETHEKTRVKIYKDYIRACGVGLFAKVDEVKQKALKIKMNDEISLINKLTKELDGLEIYYMLDKYVNTSTTIYNLIGIAFSSFAYLKGELLKIETDSTNTLEELMRDYFNFVYNPANTFMRKISVFSNYDIMTVIADRFKLLGLSVTREEVDIDHIDMIIDTVRFVKNVYDIEASNLGCKDIKFLVDVSKNIKLDEIKEEKPAELL